MCRQRCDSLLGWLCPCEPRPSLGEWCWVLLAPGHLPPLVTHCRHHTYPPCLSSATGHAHSCSGWSSSPATDCGACPEESILPHRWLHSMKTQHQAQSNVLWGGSWESPWCSLIVLDYVVWWSPGSPKGRPGLGTPLSDQYHLSPFLIRAPCLLQPPECSLLVQDPLSSGSVKNIPPVPALGGIMAMWYKCVCGVKSIWQIKFWESVTWYIGLLNFPEWQKILFKEQVAGEQMGWKQFQMVPWSRVCVPESLLISSKYAN